MMLWAGIPMFMLVATICILLFHDVKTALIVLSFFSGGGVGWTFNEARRKTQRVNLRGRGENRRRGRRES